MRRKKGIFKEIFAIIVICFTICCLFIGCEKTPDDIIVKQKGQTDLDEYAKDDIGKDTLLAKELSAPQTYQDEAVSDDGKLRIVIDADVVIPEVSRVPVYKVKEKEYTQDFIDTVTETFFGNTPMYDSEEYYAATKDEIASRIAELKEELAGGYDTEKAEKYGVTEGKPITEKEYREDIQFAIDELEKEYKAAPESNTKTAVTPEMVSDSFGKQYIVEVDQEHMYNYNIHNFCGNAIKIDRMHPQYSDVMWREGQYLKEDKVLNIEESEVKSLAGIEMEEAKAMADEKMKALGLSDLEVYDWDYGILCTSKSTMEADYQDWSVQDVGYWFYYARTINDIPVTYTDEWGGGLESMEDERETWYYERVDILLTDDGIEQVNIYSLYDKGEEEISSVQLMKFDEIMDIFKNMMLISNAEVTMYENSRSYNIDRITLGYMRIYEPGTDSRSGTIIPVWDFFGGFEGEYAEAEEENSTYKNYYKFQSHLTINAIDGTIIDRGLGY